MASEINDRDINELIKILEYCEKIEASIARFGNDFESYIKDQDYQNSIKMSIFQIGEVSNRLSDDCKKTIAELPWNEMYGLRNVIAHGYEQLIERRIWNTVTEDIPVLKTILINTIKDIEDIGL